MQEEESSFYEQEKEKTVIKEEKNIKNKNTGKSQVKKRFYY